MAAQFICRGVDLTNWVTDWGVIEDIKEMLLAKTQLFSGQHVITLSNPNGQFSPYFAGALFGGNTYFYSPAQILEDGTVVFDGFLKSIKPKPDRTSELLLENYLTIPTARIVQRAAVANENPIIAALSILQSILPSSRINIPSFYSASTQSQGATVNTDYSANSGPTALSTIQELSALASCSVYVRNGIVVAKPVVPYQGKGSGLRFEFNSSNVITFGDMTEAIDNIKNAVKITYNGGTTTMIDKPSLLYCKGQQLDIALNYGSGNIAISNLTSALIYGKLTLQRTSILRKTLPITGANVLRGVRVGDRHPVTWAPLGLLSEPMEVIETHRNITTRTTYMLLATLR